MNPGEFARLSFRSPLQEYVIAETLASGRDGMSDEQVYVLLQRIFAREIERFRKHRSFLLPDNAWSKQFARLPGGHALVLWPSGAPLLRGVHSPDRDPAEKDIWGNPASFEALSGKMPDGYENTGTWIAACRIVGGCGPRFHRALQVIQKASILLYNRRLNQVLAGIPERTSPGKDGPYR